VTSGSVILFGAGIAVEGGRAARSRPCDWEPLTPLVTVPAALVLAGSACAGMAPPAIEFKGEFRRFGMCSVATMITR
jgi:hypothetical protein